MYESFFNLSDQPFKLNPDTRFFFGSRSHNKAMAYLHYGLRQAEGFIVITGEIGAGKSILIGHLVDQLDRSNVIAAHLLTPNLKAEDLLPHILSAFNIEPAGDGKTAEIEAFEDFLFDQMNRGRRVLLIIDEAQNLPVETLEELRILSNLDYDGTPLFQVFLVGQPDFKPIIAAENMEQLRQRIIASYHLNPLNADETTAYIKHRLRVAGWKNDPTFTEKAFELINEASDGVPRRINKLCNRILLYCAIDKRHEVTAKVVRSVVDDLAAEDVSGSPMTLRAPGDDEAHDGMFAATSNGSDGIYEPNPDQLDDAASDDFDGHAEGSDHETAGEAGNAVPVTPSVEDFGDLGDVPARPDQQMAPQQTPQMAPQPAPQPAGPAASMSVANTVADTGVSGDPALEQPGDHPAATPKSPAPKSPEPKSPEPNSPGPNSPGPKIDRIEIAGESAFDRIRRQRTAERNQSASSRPILPIDGGRHVSADHLISPTPDNTQADRNQAEQSADAAMQELAAAIAKVDAPATSLGVAPATPPDSPSISPNSSLASPPQPAPLRMVASAPEGDDGADHAVPSSAQSGLHSGDDPYVLPEHWRASVTKSIDETRSDLRAAHANVSKLRRKLDDIERRRSDSQTRLLARLDRAESMLAELRKDDRIASP